MVIVVNIDVLPVSKPQRNYVSPVGGSVCMLSFLCDKEQRKSIEKRQLVSDGSAGASWNFQFSDGKSLDYLAELSGDVCAAGGNPAPQFL